ncbi:hypothetical protein CYMTET_30233 [Cymbomonas tetramitiformis]|uniref:Uncharacterized protein n=1 Tax=Cymbomonas tetramitiformis TaxID=36881 RepID=A0AAE0FJI5_9CHLO|nr:hypothetical protein CYMTET_30233 [Cymbomonas tetramitiformis]
MSKITSTTKPKGVLRGLITPKRPSSPAASASGSVSGGAPEDFPSDTKPLTPQDPILRTNGGLVREKPIHREIRPVDFLENTENLRNTPYRASTRGVLTEPLSKSFDYAENVITVLKARGYQPKSSTGFTLEGDNAKEDFLALRSAMVTVLDSVDSIETAKIFDLELAYASYNYDVNSIVFTMLSVLLRGAALDIYHSTAKHHPFDGRALLLRLHFEVEGVQRGDRGQFMEKMRALRIDERKDPHAILNDYRRLGEEHRVYHADFSDADLVWTFLVVLEKSADVSPYEVPLYQHIIEDLSTTTVAPSFDTVALRVRRVWQREGASRLARFPPPPVPDSGARADADLAELKKAP